MSEETLDEIIDGRLRIYQKKSGYRFSLDSLLLAHFISLKKNTRALELGCGSGIIMLILALRFAHVEFTGMEIQEELWKLAQKNIGINGLNDRITALKGDAKKAKSYFPASSVDCVFFNPPYRRLHSGRINPDSQKAVARHEIAGSLSVFLQAAKYLIKPAGKVFIIYPAKRLAHLIWSLRQSDMEPKRMKLVFSAADMPAEFILLEAASQGREDLKIEPSICIYNKDRKYTKEMGVIFHELAAPPDDADG